MFGRELRVWGFSYIIAGLAKTMNAAPWVFLSYRVAFGRTNEQRASEIYHNQHNAVTVTTAT